jgi:hypothetical protein
MNEIMPTKQNGTKTSFFGMSKRENHNSSIFYNSKLYTGMNIPKKINYI